MSADRDRNTGITRDFADCALRPPMRKARHPYHPDVSLAGMPRD